MFSFSLLIFVYLSANNALLYRSKRSNFLCDSFFIDFDFYQEIIVLRAWRTINIAPILTKGCQRYWNFDVIEKERYFHNPYLEQVNENYDKLWKSWEVNGDLLDPFSKIKTINFLIQKWKEKSPIDQNLKCKNVKDLIINLNIK